MVLIPIRSPLLSLCITIISVICELAFLTAALSLLRYRACRRLQANKRVRVRSQHRYVLAVTLFAMLAFVALETVTSVFSDPTIRKLVEIQPCARNRFGSTENQLSSRSEAIHFACTKIDGTKISHFEGNFSIPTSKITCDLTPMYSYIIGKSQRLPPNGSVHVCEYQSCAFVALTNDTLYISGPQRESSQIIDYLPTTINPKDADLLDLETIAATLADNFANSVTEEGEIRRRALLGSFESTCPFERDDGPATTIPLGVLIGAGIVWFLSLLLFVVSLCFRKRIFFDITHPMHWARRVRHDLGRANGDDPELEMDKVNGQVRITVTGYLPNGDDELD